MINQFLNWNLPKEYFRLLNFCVWKWSSPKDALVYHHCCKISLFCANLCAMLVGVQTSIQSSLQSPVQISLQIFVHCSLKSSLQSSVQRFPAPTYSGNHRNQVQKCFLYEIDGMSLRAKISGKYITTTSFYDLFRGLINSGLNLLFLWITQACLEKAQFWSFETNIWFSIF